MEEEVNQGTIMKTVDWAYAKAVNGIPGLETAQELADDYLKRDGTIHDKVNSLIKWQDTKAATSGFVTNLGGIITLPVAIPVNIASVIYVQIRMIAAIAHMGGYDVKDDRVKTIVYTCLVGNEAKDIAKEVGIKIGTKLTKNAISKISGKTLTKINQRVGFRLITKFGEKGIINLGKAIPLVGGLIGGTLDLLATHAIGKVSRNIFISVNSEGFITNGIVNVFQTLNDFKEGSIPNGDAVAQINELVINTSVAAAQNCAELSGILDIRDTIEANSKEIESLNFFSDHDDLEIFKRIISIVENLISESQDKPVDIELFNRLDQYLVTKQKAYPMIRSSAELGKQLGEASRIQNGSDIGARIGGLIGSLTSYICQNFGLMKHQNRLMMQTEFSNKNLQVLYEFGLKQEKVALLAKQFMEEINRLDQEFKQKAIVNKNAKQEMLDAIDDI